MMKCPYNKKVICSYLENYDSTTLYICEACSHYRLNSRVVPPEPPLAKRIFHVIVAFAIIAVIVILCCMFINHFRP